MNKPLADSFVSTVIPTKPCSVSALCAALTGASPLPQCTVVTAEQRWRRRWRLRWRWQWRWQWQWQWRRAPLHIRLNPPRRKKHFEKQTFVWPKSKRRSPGLVHLSAQAFTSLFLAILWRRFIPPHSRSTGSDIRGDLMPSTGASARSYGRHFFGL